MTSEMGQRNKDIGFIGLGSMGLGMAANLVKAGFRGKGYDIRNEAVKAFEAVGGTGGRSPVDVARGAELLIIMVLNSDQAEEVLFGKEGSIPVLPLSAVVVLCSTVLPKYSRDLAGRLAKTGHLLVDAPVSGGPTGAEKGTLTVMASGPIAAYEKARPALEAMGKNIYHFGETAGLGSTVKMINQLLCGVHIVAAAEAISLGVRAGVDPKILYDVISKSAGSSPLFQNRVPRMIEGDYATRGSLDVFVKDLGIVLDSAHEFHFPTPLAAAAHQMFLMGSAAGHGREDDSAVVKVFEKIAGICISTAPVTK